jgi:2',3'-cyclic-nucleotide 2'-phosphodiesterase/3'-nucleotidase
MTGQVRRSRLAVAVLLVALAVLGWLPAQAQDALRLRLLSTTDIHTYVVDYDYYRDQHDASLGLSRTAALIQQARAEVKNSLLFDSGDAIQGNPLGDYVAVEQPLQPGQVHPVYRAMNQLGYAAASLGNHEFNYGPLFLRTALAGASFPVVTSNVFVAGPDRAAAPSLIKPFVHLDREFVDEAGVTQRLRVGVIGFVPPQIMQWDHANLEGQVFAIDIVEAARRYVPIMRAMGVDLVVALVHSGLSGVAARGMDENAAAYLARVPGIDAILVGHAHLVFPDPSFANLPGADIARGTINGVPTVMAGFWGSHLGVVDLTLRRTASGWERVDGTATTRGIRRRQDNRWVPQWSPIPRSRLPCKRSTRARSPTCGDPWLAARRASTATSRSSRMTRRCSWWRARRPPTSDAC